MQGALVSLISARNSLFCLFVQETLFLPASMRGAIGASADLRNTNFESSVEGFIGSSPSDSPSDLQIMAITEQLCQAAAFVGGLLATAKHFMVGEGLAAVGILLRMLLRASREQGYSLCWWRVLRGLVVQVAYVEYINEYSVDCFFLSAG